MRSVILRGVIYAGPDDKAPLATPKTNLFFHYPTPEPMGVEMCVLPLEAFNQLQGLKALFYPSLQPPLGVSLPSTTDFLPLAPTLLRRHDVFL